MIYITSTIENMNLFGRHLLNVGFIYTCRSISPFHSFSTPGKWLYNSFPSRKNGYICIIVHIPPRKYGYKIFPFLLLQPNLLYSWFFLLWICFRWTIRIHIHSILYLTKHILVGSFESILYFFLILFLTHPPQASDTTYN